MLFAGIDLGTTHTKALLCDVEGRLLWEQKLRVHTRQPQRGWQEQDPRETWQNVQALLVSLARLVNSRNENCRICFSSAMHGLMAIDTDGLPVTDLLTWADLRSLEIAERIRDDIDVIAFYNKTGTPLHPMSPLCKIVWFRENYKNLLDKNIKWVSLKDWIWRQLTGIFQADHSVASASGLLNIRTRDWEPEALEIAGISRGQLPEPVSVMQRIQPERMAPGCGDWQQVPELQIGGSDGLLANMGSGATEPGDLALTIGTSGAVRVLVNEPVTLEEISLFQYAADEGRWLLGGAVNNGGNLLSWFSEVFLQGEQTPEATMQYWLDKAAQVPEGADGLVCIPWVFGERAPVWDARATASFTGVHAGHGKAHFLRAVLEGVGNNLAQIIKTLQKKKIAIERVYASGGFIASPLWISIIEKAIGYKLIINDEADASAKGAVELARRNL